jgi:hypothetical protein
MNVLMQLRKVCNHPDLFEPRAIESGLLMDSLTYKVPTICILHYYNKMQKIHEIDGLNLLQKENDVGSLLTYNTLVKYLPQKESLERMQANNSEGLSIYSNHFSYKWRQIKTEYKNENLERSFNLNAKRISVSKPIYGAHTINYIETMTNINEREDFLKSFDLVRSIDEVIFDYKAYLDNYMVCYSRSIALPPICKYSRNIRDNLKAKVGSSNRPIPL